MKYDKIVFLTKDDSSLGPMAAAALKKIRPELDVCSRGLVVLFEAPVNPKAEVVILSHDAELLSKRSKAISDMDVTRSALVVTMNESDKARFHETYSLIDAEVLNEYIDESPIDDPYGGELLVYEKCYERLFVMVKKLLLRLDKEI